MGFVFVSLWKRMVLVCFSYFSTLFGYLSHFLIRLKRWSKKRSCVVSIQSNHDEQVSFERMKDVDFNAGSDCGSFLRFRFPTYEEFLKNNGDIVNVAEGVNSVGVLTTDSSADDCVQISSEVACLVRKTESIIDDDDDVSISKDVVVLQESLINEFVGGEIDENCEEMRVENVFVGDVEEEHSVEISSVVMDDEAKRMKGIDDSRKNVYFLSDDDESMVSDSDSDSVVSSTKSSFRSSFLDSISDGFLSDIDFERVFEELEVNSKEEVLTEEDIELQNLMKGYEADDFADEDDEILQELKDIEESVKEHDNKPNSGEQLSSDCDEQNELERQWEHQDLVEQLKMEIRKVRATGLPTILEEFESPKIAEDLKPWKIEEKFPQEGTLDELLKFYKSYRERMRKLDILNYQKMYAIGVLRIKEPFQSFTRHKNFNIAALTTLMSLNCWPLKLKSVTKLQQQVMKKYSREVESDLEMVYVGQMCLSWEFLHWEYSKALDLWDSDPRGIRPYNEVAEKFQQFQVLLTRFIEDDPFQGPRVQHYVKARCVLRNLLQVPLIREDNLRDKRKGTIVVSSKDAVTSVKLVEMIEQSIRIFWQFVKSDKDTSNALLAKCRRGSSFSNIKLQNPGDADLLAQVRTDLIKKEKKMKEMWRGESCIMRKFQSYKDDRENNSGHVYFFSQVDLKLVQRVLNMSKISTDQLVWCSDKLNRIKFSGKSVVVEPSVFLFPCS